MTRKDYKEIVLGLGLALGCAACAWVFGAVWALVVMP